MPDLKIVEKTHMPAREFARLAARAGSCASDWAADALDMGHEHEISKFVALTFTQALRTWCDRVEDHFK